MTWKPWPKKRPRTIDLEIDDKMREENRARLEANLRRLATYEHELEVASHRRGARPDGAA